jgi:hypothetical protein
VKKLVKTLGLLAVKIKKERKKLLPPASTTPMVHLEL